MKINCRVSLLGVVICCACFAQGETVAYWPMVLNPATGGSVRTIADASGNGYDLDTPLDDSQVTNTTAIPFAYPPNGTSSITISSCAETIRGTELTKSCFHRGSDDQSQTKDPLILALGLRNDFTLEGYMYVKSMKHGSNADTIIAFSGINGTGDWIWNLTEPTANSNMRQVIVSIRSGSGLENNGVLATINDGEIIGGWHHYALVFAYNVGNNKSRWTFYLDGVDRGSQLMPNRGSDNNVQHDRFSLGGANSGAKKVFDAKFAFWRVSNVALPSSSMLRYQALELDSTVAYWPMNVTLAYFNGARQNIVADLVNQQNTLLIRDPSCGGVSWTTNNVGWNLPPNPDAELLAAKVDCKTTMRITSGNNTTKIGNQYRAVFSVATNAAPNPVIEATRLTKTFTLEGYFKFTELPANNEKNQMFVYNTLGEAGGWCWNVYGPGSDGNLAMKVQYNDGNRRNDLTLGHQFRVEELLNVWNHYAITFTPANGKGKTEWRFYLNGRLLGMSTSMSAFNDYSFKDPKFFLSGAPSGGSPQSLLGDMKCWRVSKKALLPNEFLCGSSMPTIPDEALVWKGSSVSTEWSTDSVKNWTANGEASVWSDGKDAYFDNNFATNKVVITGEVKPTSVNALSDYDMEISFDATSKGVIGDTCTNFVKRGFGTTTLYYTANTPMNLMKGACPIEVKEGRLKVVAANSNGSLGDASIGYEAKVYDRATLTFSGRNAIGSAAADAGNNSVFTIYTNGTFDIDCGPTDFSIQALGTLDLLGGDFIAPQLCHVLGYLMIRNRLTLGTRPDKKPYVFPAVLANSSDPKSKIGGIAIGWNTEFRIEDTTDSAASDGVFNCAVLARTCDNWQSAQNPCGFRKTGAGTMELNGDFLGGSYNQAQPSGVIAVEEGELKVNIDYRGPSKFAIADSACLSGTGKVSSVQFADGALLRVDAAETNLLEMSNADFVGGGTVELFNVPTEQIANLNAKCAKISVSATQASNLHNWTVKVNGDIKSGMVVVVRNGFLKVKVSKGLCLIVK